MVFHFAYPNVLPRKGIFIGCGRYTAKEKVPGDEYHEVRDAPVSPNKNSLKRAVQLLAAESYDSVKSIYHKQDRSEEKYQGDSLDLAWLLVNIFRARKLFCDLETDAWCTGVIQIDGRGPHLLDVNPEGFVLKLSAFLDIVNSDLLFIVPLANLDPQTREMCRENEVQVIRLGSDVTCRLSDLRCKTVLAIPADALPELLDFLFLKSGSEKTKRSKIPFYLIVVFLAGVAAFIAKSYSIPRLQEQGLVSVLDSVTGDDVEVALVDLSLNSISAKPAAPQIRVEKIVSLIEQGEFSDIPAFLKVEYAGEDLQDLKRKLVYPLAVQGEMEYRQADGTGNRVTFDSHQTPPTLTHRDYYRLRIQVENPSDMLYLYLFQVDSSGGVASIFPSSQFDTRNPVHPWQWPLTIPKKEDKWIFLDKLSDPKLKQTRESLYLLVTPWPAKDIDTLRDQLQNEPNNEEFRAQLLTRLSLWQQSGVPSITCVRWSFFHGQ